MKKAIYHTGIALLIILTIGVVWKTYTNAKVQSTLQFFPFNEKAKFSEANTSLTLKEPDKTKDKYEVTLSVNSILDQSAYLRQDMSLLFQNGRLIDLLRGWKKDETTMNQTLTVEGHESSLFEAVTIHYGEIHEDDSPTSTFKTTDASLYVISSRFGPIKSFQAPETEEQKDWAFTLRSVATSRLTKVLDRYIDKTQIDLSHYTVLPITELAAKKQALLSEYSDREQLAIIEKLWESLYSIYVTGIKKQDGTIVDPIDSTIPLILREKQSNRLILLIQDKTGNLHEFYQQLPS